MSFLERLQRWLRQFTATAPLPAPGPVDIRDYFWDRAWTRIHKEISAPAPFSYLRANVQAIVRALTGLGPDTHLTTAPDAGAGARIVLNLSSAHIKAFCKAADPAPYKNCYDLAKHKPPSTRRQMVDQSLPTGAHYQTVYFAAAELNGAGIRYYGDLCLVLKPHPDDAARTILQSNSYDLLRSPLVEHIDKAPNPDAERQKFAKSMSGEWWRHLFQIASIKILDGSGSHSRRITIGTIAERLLEDEDYIEVLWTKGGGSFGPSGLEEVRTTASDIVLENDIYARARRAAPLTLAQMQWARRRREAARILASKGLRLRTIAHLGRARE